MDNWLTVLILLISTSFMIPLFLAMVQYINKGAYFTINYNTYGEGILEIILVGIAIMGNLFLTWKLLRGERIES